MTEKRKQTYDLDAIKAAFSSAQGLRATGTAIKGAAALGYGRAEIVATIQTIERRQFFKSMTAYADHTVWQDVYRPRTRSGDLYLKLTVIEDVLVVSFKEL